VNEKNRKKKKREPNNFFVGSDVLTEMAIKISVFVI
jgi:hypothetical protein